jgi:hypothetical protein
LLDIATTGPDGRGIGTSADPIRTNIAMLDAETNNGGIFIDEADGLLIVAAKAKEQSQAGQVGAGPSISPSQTIVVRTQGGEILGTHDVEIQAGGDLIVETVSAPDAVTLSATGTIIDNNEDANNIFARSVDLEGADGVGIAVSSIDTIVEAANADSANGSVYVNLGLPASITASAANGKEIKIKNAIGDTEVHELTAIGGSVTLETTGGAITDGNGGADNVTADTLVITGKDDVGSSTDDIETNVDILSIELTDKGASFFVKEVDSLSQLTVKVNDGGANIDFTGTLDFDAATDVLSASGVTDFTFENTGGGLVLNDIDATGKVGLTASEAITQQAGDVSGTELSLQAATHIGASGTPVETDVDTLDALATSVDTFAADAGTGGVSVANNKALTIGTVDGIVGISAGGTVDVATSSPLTIANDVIAQAAVTLTAGDDAANAGDDLTVNDGITVSSQDAVTLTAGDHVVLGTGSSVSGTAIAITANNDGAGDAVAGGITAAGSITASSLVVTGDSLNQTGAIVSTGIVDLNLTGDATQGADITGTDVTIVQTGNTTATTVDINGDSLDQQGNIVSSGSVNITTTGNILMSGNISGTTIDIDSADFTHSGSIVATGDVDIDGAEIAIADIQADGQVVAIVATGAITDNNDDARNVLARDLKLIGPAGVGASDNALETEVTSFAANGGTGGIFVADTGGLNLRPTDGQTLLEATGGAIKVSTTGDLKIDNGFVQGAGLVASLTATDGSILEINAAADADIVADTINLVSNGAGNTIGTGADALEIDANILNASTEDGDINIENTAGGLAIGLVNAPGKQAQIVSAGSITAVTPDDSTAEITATDIVLESGGTIGLDGSSLEIDGVTLDAETSGGGIYLTDLAGGIDLHTIDAGAGDVKLHVVDGSITAVADGGAADIIGNELHISVSDPGSHIGLAAAPIEIDGVILRSVTTEGGNIYLHDLAGGIAVDLVSNTGSVGSVIELSATNGSIVENPDDDADFVTESLVLTATGSGTIGTGAEAIEIEADNLSATTEGGGIWLTDLSGGIVIDTVSTGGAPGSVITLTALNGSILETEPGDDATDLHAETVNLTVTGENQSIGTPTNGLEILADNIVLDGGERIFLEPKNPNATPPPPNVSFGPNPAVIAVLGDQVLGGAAIHLYKQAITVLDPYSAIQLFILSDPSFPQTGELILAPEGLK